MAFLSQSTLHLVLVHLHAREAGECGKPRRESLIEYCMYVPPFCSGGTHRLPAPAPVCSCSDSPASQLALSLSLFLPSTTTISIIHAPSHLPPPESYPLAFHSRTAFRHLRPASIVHELQRSFSRPFCPCSLSTKLITHLPHLPRPFLTLSLRSQIALHGCRPCAWSSPLHRPACSTLNPLQALARAQAQSTRPMLNQRPFAASEPRSSTPSVPLLGQRRGVRQHLARRLLLHRHSRRLRLRCPRPPSWPRASSDTNQARAKQICCLRHRSRRPVASNGRRWTLWVWRGNGKGLGSARGWRRRRTYARRASAVSGVD